MTDPTPTSRDNWTPEQRLVAGDWGPTQAVLIVAAIIVLLGIAGVAAFIGFGVHWLFRAVLG